MVAQAHRPHGELRVEQTQPTDSRYQRHSKGAKRAIQAGVHEVRKGNFPGHTEDKRTTQTYPGPEEVQRDAAAGAKVKELNLSWKQDEQDCKYVPHDVLVAHTCPG